VCDECGASLLICAAGRRDRHVRIVADGGACGMRVHDWGILLTVRPALLFDILQLLFLHGLNLRRGLRVM